MTIHMSVHIYAHVYARVYACAYALTYAHVWTNVYTHKCESDHARVCAHACTWQDTCLDTCSCTLLCRSIRLPEFTHTKHGPARLGTAGHGTCSTRSLPFVTANSSTCCTPYMRATRARVRVRVLRACARARLQDVCRDRINARLTDVAQLQHVPAVDAERRG